MGLIGTLFGGRTGRERRQDREFESAFTPLINQQATNSRDASTLSHESLHRGDMALDPALDFWTKAASGDTNALQRLLGPQLDTIAEADAGKARSLSEFGARGGRRSEMMGELSDDESNQINKLLLSLRPEAMSQLSQLAQLLYGTGVSELNASTGASGNALQALLSNRGLNLNERQMRLANLNQQAEGLGQMFAMMAGGG